MINFSQKQIEAAGELINSCIAKQQKIVCAESCTGGLLSALLTEIAGSSEVFERGFIVYSNQAKIDLLSVRPQTIEEHGAVSSKTAKEMAIGARNNSAAQFAVAITGIAGPKGGSQKKPVGTVFIAFAYDKKVTAKKFLFSGERSEVRQAAVEEAIRGLQQLIAQN